MSPFRQRRCWCGNDRLGPRSAARWTVVRDCSRSLALESFRWCRCSGGIRRRYGTRVRDTSCVSPGYWQGWCSYWAPSPGRSSSELRTTRHCDYIPEPSASLLRSHKTQAFSLFNILQKRGWIVYEVCKKGQVKSSRFTMSNKNQEFMKDDKNNLSPLVMLRVLSPLATKS